VVGDALFAPLFGGSFQPTTQPLGVHCFNVPQTALTLSSVNVEENRNRILIEVNLAERLCPNLQQLTLRHLGANFCHFFFEKIQFWEPIEKKLTICLPNWNETPHSRRIIWPSDSRHLDSLSD
jgi:hypothetical protein